MSEFAQEPAVDAAPEAGEAAESAWSGVSQEQWEEFQTRQQATEQWVQQRMLAEQQAAQQGQPMQFDPWSDDPTGQIQALIDARLAERVAPLEQTYRRIEDAEGQELAYDVIADNVAREGDFLFDGSKEDAFNLARTFLPQTVQKYGYGDRAAEAAIEMACAHVREREQAIGKAFYERQTNQLHTLANATGEPRSAGAAPQVAAGQYAPGQSVASRFFGGRQ